MKKHRRDGFTCAKGKTPINADRAVICSLHFQESAYESRLKYQLLGLPIPKSQLRVKVGSFPTLQLPTSQGPQPVGNMKAMEQGAAPMISVPAGVIKEFMTSSPSPPAASLVNTETTTDSPKAPSQTRTPSPDLPNMLNDSALPTDTSKHIVNGVVQSSESDVINDNCNINNSVTMVPTDTSDSTKAQTDSQMPVVSDIVDKRINGTINDTPSLKRPSEEPQGSKPDLKKVRVFSDEKNKSIESSVQAFNKHLDQESKKLGESDTDEITCLSSVNVLKPEERTSGDNTNNSDSVKSVTPSDVPTKIEDLLQKLEDKSDIKLDVKSNVVPVQKENVSLFASDLEVLTPKENDTFKQEKSKIPQRLRKLSRKELEKIIMRLFSEKTLYQCELGRQKQLCEKLETTLEANRKKTAQFHKEIEDLKKVTNRLSAEQASRKGQFVAPIRIKRSVGIQAAPHIINKGLQHAQNSAIKTISPRAGHGKVSSGPGIQGGRMQNSSQNVTFQTKMIPSHSPNKVGGGAVGGMLSTSQQGGRPQPLGGAVMAGMQGVMTNTSVPLGTVTQSSGNIGTVRPATGQMMLMAQQTPGMMQTIPRPVGGGRATLGRSQAGMPAPGTLVKVPVTGPTQLVAIPQSAGQVVLLPNTSAGTALVVSQVSAVQTVNTVGNPIMAQARSGQASTPRVMGTSFRPISAPTTTGSSLGVPQHRHPAPLPRTPVQQVAGITKKLPPQPTLKLSHKENSIVLSWTMAKTEDHETIASYQLYAYQEGNSPPSAALWKKVGSVKALELPMACTLTQFMPGHVYHFAVRAVDIKSRLGPFSDPRSIRLEKK